METKAEFIESNFVQIEKHSSRSDEKGRNYLNREHNNVCQGIYAHCGVIFYQFERGCVALYFLKEKEKRRWWDIRAQKLFQHLPSLQSAVPYDVFEVKINALLNNICPLRGPDADRRHLLDTEAKKWLGKIFDLLIENDYFPLESGVLSRLLFDMRYASSCDERAEKMWKKLREMFLS